MAIDVIYSGGELHLVSIRENMPIYIEKPEDCEETTYFTKET